MKIKNILAILILTTLLIGCTKQPTCKVEGEQFPLKEEKQCCDGLTEWSSGMDTTISIEDKCYQTDMMSGSPTGTCINCGNGICEDIENPCNCPKDCVGKGKSTFQTVDEFCKGDVGYYCSGIDAPEELCTLCKENCAKEGEQVEMSGETEGSLCCEGLTEWASGFDTRISIGDRCYATDMESGNPMSTCINCGDGICDEKETVCNCMEDCQDNTNSDFKSMDEFCEKGGPDKYCETNPDLAFCKLC